MFENEVIVSTEDKERLVALMKEANAILEKYPYFSKPDCHTVTCVSRAKNAVKEARDWCGMLYTEPNKNN